MDTLTAVITDDFESGTLSQWLVTQEGDGTFVNSTNARNGTRGATSTVTANTGSKANLQKALADETTAVQISGDWRVRSVGGAGSNVPFTRMFTGAQRLADIYRDNTTGKLWARITKSTAGGATFNFIDLGYTMALNTWVNIIWSFDLDGNLYVNINGTVKYNAVVADRWAAANINVAYVGAEHPVQVGVFDVDNIAVAIPDPVNFGLGTVLEEMQFELLPDEDASEGFAFGIGLEVSIDDDGFDPGSLDWVTQDSENQRNGATNFGTDYLLGPTWAWSAHVNRADTPGALETLNRAATAWRGNNVANVAGKVAPLRYRMGDRVRRVYGRPRKFSGVPNNRILGGFIPIVEDFKCVDSYTYADDLNSVSLSTRTSPPSGFVFPVVFPLTPPVVPDAAIPAFIEGDAPAWPKITIKGPVTNPYLQTKNWKLSLAIELGPKDVVVIDTRPWSQSVMLNGSTSLAGLLGRRQWLSDMFLEPGAAEAFTFGGTSTSSAASCAVSWRSTYNSL